MTNSTRVLGRAAALAAALWFSLGPSSLANDDLNQGLEYFKTGKYAEAAAKFQSMVDGSPNYDFGYYMLGLSYLQLGKPKDAETPLLKAIEINGNKFEYHHGLAKSYLERKDAAKAVATLKTAEPLASTPQQKYPLYSLRGFAYATLEKWPETVDDLEKAKAINPQPSVLVQLGKAYMSLGYSDKAAPVFRQAAQGSPNDAATNEMLAGALLDMGAEAKDEASKKSLYAEALQVADRVVKLKPNDYQSYNLVGRAALGATDYAKAEQSFRKVLAQKADYCWAMANLGKTYIAQSKWADAETILIDATKCAPRMAVAFESLGFAQQKQEKLAEAIKTYEAAQAIKPSDSVARAIATCKQNLEIAEHNQMVASEEAKAEQAEADAKKAYDEAMKKQKEWEDKRKRDE